MADKRPRLPPEDGERGAAGTPRAALTVAAAAAAGTVLAALVSILSALFADTNLATGPAPAPTVTMTAGPTVTATFTPSDSIPPTARPTVTRTVTARPTATVTVSAAPEVRVVLPSTIGIAISDNGEGGGGVGWITAASGLIAGVGGLITAYAAWVAVRRKRAGDAAAAEPEEDWRSYL